MPHSKGCSLGHHRVRWCHPSTAGLVPPGQHEEGDSPAHLLLPSIFLQPQHQHGSLQPASPSLPGQQQVHSAGKLKPRVEPGGAQLRASRDGSSQPQPCGTAVPAPLPSLAPVSLSPTLQPQYIIGDSLGVHGTAHACLLAPTGSWRRQRSKVS